MNSSSGSNASDSTYRDSYTTVLAKNVLVLFLGLIVNYINGSLIHTFRKHQIFYVNPRYILFIHLVVNDMIQLTTTITLFVLSYAFYAINVSLCCVFITFTVFTTFNTPLNLAVMAAECYVAICLPLRHAELCTVGRTYAAIGLIWAASGVSVLLDVVIVVATEPVGWFHSTVFCNRDSLFRHPIHFLKRDVSYGVYLAAVWLTLLFTYVKIFWAAKASSASNGDTKKARSTILLHGFQLLLCMFTYVTHLVRNAAVRHFPGHEVNVAFSLYIVVHIVPRLLSPVVYGLRDKSFRRHLKKYLCP
ncbi:odorant receptor 131-2-like [Cyclopterus lumpus]|uniref:odorant receptor 131-2-like n=1 Tax=Cyclopterus lumpus TaxID=8103 RepID=UPI001485CD69|nr:odorant receptor 131-2-like [Cyclopterus lumpus]